MVRKAQIEDLEAITEIYNQAIDARFQTCYTERLKVEDRLDWFYQHQGDSLPLFVIEMDGRVAGWLSVSPYRQGRNALKYAVEISYFLDRNYQQKGLGTKLLDYAIARCSELGFKTLLAILIDRNIASTKLLEKFGFELWGVLPDIAEFDGVLCGQYYFGLRLQN